MIEPTQKTQNFFSLFHISWEKEIIAAGSWEGWYEA